MIKKKCQKKGCRKKATHIVFGRLFGSGYGFLWGFCKKHAKKSKRSNPQVLIVIRVREGK